MKRLVILSASVLLLLSGCGGPGQQFAGTMIGAHVGGVLGRAAFGGHSYGGAVFGDVVGTLAGAAVGAAVTAPRQEVVVVEDDDPGRYQRPSDSRYDATTKQRRPSYRLEPVKTEESKALADLKVKNLRFVDQNRNRIINSNERCQLLFDVVNDGEVAMHDVTPYIYEVNLSKYIHISNPSTIDHLRPGESAHYVIDIRTDRNLREGVATFCIELTNGHGLSVPCREFDLETAR